MKEDKWPNVARVVWCQGGVAATNQPGPVAELNLGVFGTPILQFRLSTYGSLFEQVRSFGLRIIGCTFVSRVEQMEFWEPAEFRVASLKHGWIITDLAQRWSEVAHHSGRQGAMNLSDIASRLQSGYRHVQSRLGELSEAYGLQLSAACRKRPAEEYSVFHDGNSAKVYMCISALFWELAVLRDCLAEFYAEFVFDVADVDNFSGLLKKIEKTSRQPETAAMLATIGKRGGWLNLFTEYRNFFTHVIPLEQASNLAFAIQDQITLNNGIRAAQLYYPLPADTRSLRERKSKKIYYSSFEEMAIANAYKKDRSKEPDALAYLHECLDAFVQLGEQALRCSPVVPSPIVFTEADIIGPVITTHVSN